MHEEEHTTEFALGLDGVRVSVTALANVLGHQLYVGVNLRVLAGA